MIVRGKIVNPDGSVEYVEFELERRVDYDEFDSVFEEEDLG